MRSYRQEVGSILFGLIQQGKLPKTLPPPVTIHLEFFLCRKNPWLSERCYFPKDEGNARASFKAAQDAFVDAGLLPNDSHYYVHDGRTRLYTREKDHQGRAMIVVTIELEDTNE